MNLLDSLLDAITRLEGDALVMHVGEKPYVVTTSSSMGEFRGPIAWGQVELSSRVLTPEAVLGMLGQILPLDQRHALEEFGAVEYEVAPPDGSTARFTLVAARGGDDVWLEVRRHLPPPVAEPEPAPEPAVATPSADAVAKQEPAPEAVQPHADVAEDEPFEIVPEVAQAAPTDAEVDALLAGTAAALTHTERKTTEPPRVVEPEPVAVEPEPVVVAEPEPVAVAPAPVAVAPEPVVFAEPEPVAVTPEPVAAEPEPVAVEPEPLPVAPEAEFVAPPEPVAQEAPPPITEAPEPVAIEEPEPEPIAEETPIAADPVPVAFVPEPPPVEPPAPVFHAEDAESEERSVVVPLTRRPVRPDTRTPPPAMRGIDDVLRIAAARGASTVFIVAQSRPTLRTDGEMTFVDVPPTTAADVDRIVQDLAPDTARDAWERGTPGEWLCDVEGVGRVRCLTFRDHRGPGVIFRMVPPQVISADQLELTPEVQALCSQSEGLVLVAGPRGSGKSRLLAAFLDLINRTRSDHVISIETQIGFVHESRRSFVSQREVPADSEHLSGAVRSALREDPDVLLVSDIPSADVVSAVFEAAESGRLIFASITAPSAAAAVDRLIDLYPADRRTPAREVLAGSLRGVVAQVLLRRLRGGRVAAREVLLNTPQAAALIQDGRMLQLPAAIESGRRQGMVPLNDALAALVRDGTVHVTEAYRKAVDKDGLLAILRPDGLDTSFAERLA
ncbi:MAG TPA: ATPase, T2SS/T4P/T4SS family [Vicinamibacterales bacterium]|nr:ATPase, T2SS/T4P/T4SS family [Vicinamibacterales bacterium]